MVIFISLAAITMKANLSKGLVSTKQSLWVSDQSTFSQEASQDAERLQMSSYLYTHNKPDSMDDSFTMKIT
jgi:hypothetical protein